MCGFICSPDHKIKGTAFVLWLRACVCVSSQMINGRKDAVALIKTTRETLTHMKLYHTRQSWQIVFDPPAKQTNLRRAQGAKVLSAQHLRLGRLLASLFIFSP